MTKSMEAFRIREVIRLGWEKFKKHLAFSLKSAFVILVILTSLDWLQTVVAKKAGLFLGITVDLTVGIVTILITAGILRVYMDVVDQDKEDALSTLLAQGKYFWRIFLGTFLIQLPFLCLAALFSLGMAVLSELSGPLNLSDIEVVRIFLATLLLAVADGGIEVFGWIMLSTSLPLILLILGIYLAIRFQFFSFLVIDKDVTLKEALRKSSEMTYGIKRKLLGLGIILVSVNIIGAMLFLVGLLVTVPLTVYTYTYVYRLLLKRLEQPVAVEVTPGVPAPVAAEVQMK